jgi:hypothetical protein
MSARAMPMSRSWCADACSRTRSSRWAIQSLTTAMNSDPTHERTLAMADGGISADDRVTDMVLSD